MSKAQINRNASHRITIETESYWLAWKISLLLMIKYRFKRKGRFISGLDEVIYFDYKKTDLKIHSGWDIWCGYDWSADNENTDDFLLEFFENHLK